MLKARESPTRFGKILLHLIVAVLLLDQGKAVGVGKDPCLDRVDSAAAELLDDVLNSPRQLGTCGDSLQNTDNRFDPIRFGPSIKTWR